MYGPDSSISTVTSHFSPPAITSLPSPLSLPPPPSQLFLARASAIAISTPMATHQIRPSHVLDVAPLNSIPYFDPVESVDNPNPVQQGVNNQPSLFFVPSQPTGEQLNNFLSVTTHGVMISGSAAMGMIGPLVGKLDIGEDDTSYIFRVALPGVAREEFSCDVAPDGQILIRGITTTGEKIVYKESMKFEMMTQNLCPSGHFSISFKLPGPVDSQQLDAVFGIDGVFEGIVKKKKKIHEVV